MIRTMDKNHPPLTSGTRKEKPTVREIVMQNLAAILGQRSPEEYCRQAPKLHYVSGTKAGKPVAARTLRYALEGDFSPSIELLEAVAAREDIAAYQILLPDLDPKDAPVVITRAQGDLMRRLQSDFEKLRPV